MRRYYLVHLGIGNVGHAVVRQILEIGQALRQQYSTELIYCGLFNANTGIFDANSLTREQITAFPSNGKSINVAECINRLPGPSIVIDTTASDGTMPLLLQALKQGSAVVMSNKKPLSGKNADFVALNNAAENKRLLYETTVGAGLPVIRTIKAMLAIGDTITSIEGCLSGTLGFIFSELEAGNTFSASVAKAKTLGYTEPDPRDDLSGMDVARKALILVRLLGYTAEIDAVDIEKLYPDTMSSLSNEEFLARLGELDQDYQQRHRKAQKTGKTLRFVVTIREGVINIGVKAVEKSSEIGALHGPDNIIVIRSKHYNQNPLVIKGPGAGIDVTAAGVVGDILEATKALHGAKGG